MEQNDGQLLYHGSTKLVTTPRIVNRNNDVDFGPGFYTTESEAQAIAWARLKAATESRVPILNAYRYTPNTELIIKSFKKRDEDWLRFVYQSRFKKKPHDFDVVCGYCIQGTALSKMKMAAQLGYTPKFSDLVACANAECRCEQTVFCSPRSFVTLQFAAELSRPLAASKNFSQTAPIVYPQETLMIIAEVIKTTVNEATKVLVDKYHLSEKFFLDWLYQSQVYQKLINIPLEYWGLADEDIIRDIEQELTIGEQR